jgi:NitT/TauT family transport system substrate-binding protein
VKSDFEFYTVSGQLQGEPASLKLEDFWDLKAVDAARAKVGG